MKTLQIEHASIRQNVKNGYILVWKDEGYESVLSWQIYATKGIALDIIKLLVILGYVQSLDFKYTVHNTMYKFYSERDNIYLLLYTEDQTLIEQYDQAVLELIEDGFIDPRNVHESLVEYYNTTFAM